MRSRAANENHLDLAICGGLYGFSRSLRYGVLRGQGLAWQQSECVLAGRVQVIGLGQLLMKLALQPVIASHLFSSISATVGNAGQANYASANAVLDTMACNVSATGMPTSAAAWGPWSGAGMATADVGLLARLHRQGSATFSRDLLEVLYA